MLEMQVLDQSQTIDFDARTAAAEPEQSTATVCVVGLGYVGLPVAVEFGKLRPTVGYDLSTKKVHSLKQHFDATGEVSADELRQATQLECTDNPEKIREADFIIVAVPTPVERRAPARLLAADGRQRRPSAST